LVCGYDEKPHKERRNADGRISVATVITGDEMCKAMHWPLPLPPTVGWSLMHMTNDSILTCFDNVVAIAPDGHDAQNDPVQSAFSWKVTSMTPPAGTMVMMDRCCGEVPARPGSWLW
jgi:hypothetical protein